jgi:phage shock protein PspC (stress-responsive transcriptional regulator)
MNIPKEFFTTESIGTLTGAAGIVFVVCNGMQRAFDFNPKWLALSIAVLIGIIGAHQTTEGGVINYIMGLINGFLIFCTAAGATEFGHATNKQNQLPGEIRGIGPKKDIPQPIVRRALLNSWFNG